MPRSRTRDLVELFGFAPTDLSDTASSFWELEACPFISAKCVKYNHDQTITYGTCSVSTSGKEIIICPNRLYAEGRLPIRKVAADAFGEGLPLYDFSQYLEVRGKGGKFVVALGQNSGREIKIGRSFSMDWVLALIEDKSLSEYVGIEVQSIDITGNYRDAWHGYKDLRSKPDATIPESEHGLNYANVHKRLIPQLIRKGVVYSKSKYVKRGLYFIIPDIVFSKFEEVVGTLTNLYVPQNDSITVHTYGLGPKVPAGQQRKLKLMRRIRFGLNEFSQKFISGPNLPSGEALDRVIIKLLGIR